MVSMKVNIEEIRQRSNTWKILMNYIRSRRWKWLGHILRMSPNMNPKIALTWAPESKHSKGQPRRDMEKDSFKREGTARVQYLE